MHIQVVIKIHFMAEILTTRPFTDGEGDSLSITALTIFDSFSFPAFVFAILPRFPFTIHLHLL